MDENRATEIVEADRVWDGRLRERLYERGTNWSARLAGVIFAFVIGLALGIALEDKGYRDAIDGQRELFANAVQECEKRHMTPVATKGGGIECHSLMPRMDLLDREFGPPSKKELRRILLRMKGAS